MADLLSLLPSLGSIIFEAMRITEISKMLGVSDKKWVRERYVVPLLGKGLKLTMLEKPNSRLQKYLTDDKK